MCHIFHSWILMSEERIILTAVEYRPASEKRRWSSISAVGSASDRQTPSMKRASRHHWSQPRRQRLHDHWGSWTRQRWTWITRNTHTHRNTYRQTDTPFFTSDFTYLLICLLTLSKTTVIETRFIIISITTVRLYQAVILVNGQITWYIQTCCKYFFVQVQLCVLNI